MRGAVHLLQQSSYKMRRPLFLLFLTLPFVFGQFSQFQQEQSISQPLPQCQCIPDPKAGCVQYDSRFQAATLDEAMSSFPDLTLERNETSPDPTLDTQVACTTQECIDCQNDLNYRLKKIGLLPLAIGEVLPPTQNLTSTCKKYKFSGKEEGVYDKDDEEPHALTYRPDDDDSDDSDESGEKQKKKRKREKEGDRRKRQAPLGSTVTIVGQRYTLSCSAKGIATDSTGLVSLCSSCWVWRRLPDNYSPQFINELVCDQSDGACLSGYATCGIGHRSVDVVQTNGNVKTTVSISAGSFCECKVAKSSALLSLVTGNSTTAEVPPLLGMPPVPGG